jgi:hypothetical protein
MEALLESLLLKHARPVLAWRLDNIVRLKGLPRQY